MFAQPRQRYPAPPPRKKRKADSAIEEITFDSNAREDYLTGFHKRKLQRIKQAKEEAAKRDREEKLAARKILRDSRKADLEKHVEAVNSMLRQQGEHLSDSSEQEDARDEATWEGFAENPVIDHEDAYLDEDRLTSVTVEAVDVSRDGLRKAVTEKEDESDDPSTEPSERSDEGPIKKGRVASETVKRTWTKEPPVKPKKRKKQFKYESKAERKMTRHKEKSGNKVRARERKGK